MRTRNLLILKWKQMQSWRIGPRRQSQKARSQRPMVFPAKTQKAVRSHRGKILERSKDHSGKRRSTHHKKKRDVKLSKPSWATLKNWCTKGWSYSYTWKTVMNWQIYQFLYHQKQRSRDWNAKSLRPPEYRPDISSLFWKAKSGQWRIRKRFASAGQ